MLGAHAPSTVYPPDVVFPFTFTLGVPRPSVPALFTLATDPDDIESTCVKFRVFSGTAVIVFWSTSVPVDGATARRWHAHSTATAASPGSSTASSTGNSDALSVNCAICAVLKPSRANSTW